jgi:hypothetical protein
MRGEEGRCALSVRLRAQSVKLREYRFKNAAKVAMDLVVAKAPDPVAAREQNSVRLTASASAPEC